jgi:hypothetical protein
VLEGAGLMLLTLVNVYSRANPFIRDRTTSFTMQDGRVP